MRQSTIGCRIHPDDLSIWPRLRQIGRKDLSLNCKESRQLVHISASLDIDRALFHSSTLSINRLRTIQSLQCRLSRNRRQGRSIGITEKPFERKRISHLFKARTFIGSILTQAHHLFTSSCCWNGSSLQAQECPQPPHPLPHLPPSPQPQSSWPPPSPS